MSDTHPRPSRTRRPLVFVVASDRAFLDSTFAECADAPRGYTHFPSIRVLIARLSRMSRVDLAFVVVVERSCERIDPIELRSCKLEFPQLNFLLVLEECTQTSILRFQSIGVQNILLPPYADVSITGEIAVALPNVPQFKRHPDLMRRGSAILDFLIPSELSYVLGVNYMVSLLLKEFSFPTADRRVNIPLACDEALTNAILHGNDSNPEKKVAIKVYVSASRFKIRIKDEGEGFEVDRVDDPTQGEGLVRRGGRGVYLMKTIMDRVEYRDGGRVVELEKANTSTNPPENAPGK